MWSKCAALLLLSLAPQLYGAATIVIVNGDGPGEGFNDPTPAAPVGGNTGTTVGAQRLIAFQRAANIWGASLNSSVPIRILALFDPLPCDASSAVLGSAGPTLVWYNFPGAPFRNTWYSGAEANALVGIDIYPPLPPIKAQFNANLGRPDCLAGSPFYLGLDNNHGPLIDLVTVLLHEFGHGLGFLSLTDDATGQFFGPPFLPGIYERFLLDTTLNKTWDAMTDSERAFSATNPRNVVWNGSAVTANSSILDLGSPRLLVSAPKQVAGSYAVGNASFGPPLESPGVTAELMPAVDQPDGTGLACDPFSRVNALAVTGKIAVIDRGACPFTTKVKNAQNAGALGVVIVDNVPGAPPSGFGGADPTITIPAVRISLADGTALKAALRFRSRVHSGVVGNLGVDLSLRAGADPQGRVLMFTPNPVQPGSSTSHWDTLATPNLLMEPNINPDLQHAVKPPFDLTLPALHDIGWVP